MRRGIRFTQWWMLLVAILAILSGQGSLVGRADSKFQSGLGSGCLIAIFSSAVLSCITACMPALID